MIVDNFFSGLVFSMLRVWADAQNYAGVRNPVDDTVYPGICAEFPDNDFMRERVENKLAELNKGKRVKIKTLFMRLSVEGTPTPQPVHTDISMGQLTFLLYMNRKEHCKGGTRVLRHVTGLDRSPATLEEMALLERDCRDLDQWETLRNCPMAPNRAFILPSHHFHLAEPVGGFGSCAKDGRLVMVGFGDLEA